MFNRVELIDVECSILIYHIKQILNRRTVPEEIGSFEHRDRCFGLFTVIDYHSLYISLPYKVSLQK